MKLYLIVPCYNEEKVLPLSSSLLKAKMESLIAKNIVSPDSKILFVDDGSKDATKQIIEDLHRSFPIFSGLFLSRNRGHQNALLAGLHYCKDKCDAAISLDCDLQDDIDAIDDMIEKYLDGAEIVYGVRNNRKSDTLFKRTTANLFYKITNKLGGSLIENHADYRLMSKRSLEALSKYNEVNLFLRGIVPMLGFKSDFVYYQRKKRIAGKTKYPFFKMLSFATEGITSLSTRPISIIIVVGFFITLLSLALLIYSLIRYFGGYTVSGWTSTFLSIWLLGGLQLMSIGVIGKYVGKTYMEAKHRPPYIISEILDD